MELSNNIINYTKLVLWMLVVCDAALAWGSCIGRIADKVKHSWSRSNLTLWAIKYLRADEGFPLCMESICGYVWC